MSLEARALMLEADVLGTDLALSPGSLKASLGSRPSSVCSRQARGLAAFLASALLLAIVGLASRGSRSAEMPALVAQADVMERASAEPPSLFCWSHMMPGGYEVPLLEMQLIRRAGIFACEEFAVISTEKIEIGELDNSSIFTWVNNAPEVSMGQRGVEGQTTDSFLNTEIFLLAWDTLISSGRLWAHSFVVKADPDAVFFPDRLQKHVAQYQGTPVYFPNCLKWGHPLLYGALEVLSTEALGIYKDRLAECKALPWHGWGEDYYIQHCMDMLGVAQAPDGDQVADDRCIGAPCSDWTKVAFHDFKSPEEWYTCFQTAIGESRSGEHDRDEVEVFFKK